MVICLCMLGGMMPAVGPGARAAGNQSLETAQEILSGQNVTVTMEPGGAYYYAVKDVTAGQFLCLVSNAETVKKAVLAPNGAVIKEVSALNRFAVTAEENGTHYLRFNAVNLTQAATFNFTLTVQSNDGYEPNNSSTDAPELPLDQSVEFVLGPDDEDWFKVTTSYAGQVLVLTPGDANTFFQVYDPQTLGTLAETSNGLTKYYVTNNAGSHYIRVQNWNTAWKGLSTDRFTAQVLENDVYEPNGSRETAEALTLGESVKIVTCPGDKDYFRIAVDSPGQFLTATLTGEEADVSFYYEDESGSLNAVNSGRSWYLSADQVGTYYILCEGKRTALGTEAVLTVTAQNNDDYEPNGSSQTARSLTPGQQAELVLGPGDEDWFKVDSTMPGQFLRASVTAEQSVSVSVYSADAVTEVAAGEGTNVALNHLCEETGTFYVRVALQSGLETRSAALTVSLTDNDGREPNNTPENATGLASAVTADMVLGGGDEDWFAVETTSDSQVMLVEAQGTELTVSVYATDGKTLLAEGRGDAVDFTAVGGSAGTHYIRCVGGASIAEARLTVTLKDNDGFEPNESRETAKGLESGETADVILAPGDEDWFEVRTTAPGQDVRVDISGFSGENRGELRIDFDSRITRTADTNSTFYFHAAEAGSHYIRLYGGRVKNEAGSYVSGWLPVSMSVTAEEGDAGETAGNDSSEGAQQLLPDTDASFAMDGLGDEDWFWFESDLRGGTETLYTLRFLDLDADGSDGFVYEIYAPDGTMAAAATLVEREHARELTCDQQGLYRVRIMNYCQTAGEYLDISRSQLRLRVSWGGDDPWERNDTWQQAAALTVGQTVRHVLADTQDRDWFRFTAERADMCYVLEKDLNATAELYRAEELQQLGDDAEPFCTDGAGKLAGAGVYYLCLRAASAAETAVKQRTFTLTLAAHAGEENNDTWDSAAPLYADAPRSFDIAGKNDTDWFSLEVPAGSSRVTVCLTGSGLTWALYSGESLRADGTGATPLYSGSDTRKTEAVQPGTYYVRVTASGAAPDGAVCFSTFAEAGGTGREDAVKLEPGVWSERRISGTCYSIGALSAGTVVRFSRDSGGSTATVRLYSAGGVVRSSDYANFGFEIPSDGEYYLYVEEGDTAGGSAAHRGSRIRYTVGAGESWASALTGPDEITLIVGEAQFAEFLLTPSDAKGGTNRIYVSSNGSGAVYDERTGCLTASAAGTGEMTFAVNCNGVTLEKTVSVTAVEPTAAESVTISGAPEELAVGESVQLAAVLEPDEATERAVWSSSDTGVLYVTAEGKVVAAGEGSAEITAAVAAGSATVTIRVTDTAREELTGLGLNVYTLTMYLGEGTQQLAALPAPEGAAPQVEWTSGDTSVATVEQDGTVTAVGSGVCVITARAGGYSAGCVVTVQPRRVRVTGISFGEETGVEILLGGIPTMLTPTIQPVDATVKALTWVSDDERVATVSSAGIVTAVAMGETTVRVTTVDGGFTAEIRVAVKAEARSGDINGDGYIDSGDALMTLQVAVGKRQLTEDEQARADVNGDGQVDAGDAIRILRYDAGLIDSL